MCVASGVFIRRRVVVIGIVRGLGRSGVGWDLLWGKFIKKSHQKANATCCRSLARLAFPIFPAARCCFPWPLHIYDDWQIKNANKFQFLTCRRHTRALSFTHTRTQSERGGAGVKDTRTTWQLQLLLENGDIRQQSENATNHVEIENEMQTSGYATRSSYAYLWKVQSSLVKSAGMSCCCIVIK